MLTLLPSFKELLPIQKKSHCADDDDISEYYGCGNVSLISCYRKYKEYTLAAKQALLYYDACAPLFSGADWIAKEISVLEVKAWDKTKQVYLKTHPLLDLLEDPNTTSTYDQFMYALATYLMITGNAYLMVQFNGVKQMPAALFVIPSQEVSINTNGNGFIESYQITGYNDISTLKFESIFENGKIRYITADGVLQLFHFKNFNACGNQVYGSTRLNSVYLEIEQYITAGIHNLTLLERGGNLSGVFSSDQVLGDEEFQRSSKIFQQQFSGVMNAGVFGILDAGFKFNKISSTNKDMDFLALKKSVTETIYNNLRVPLALVTPETMTMANMAAAKILLYDNAVLPAADRLFVELTKVLMPFYTTDKNLVLKYDMNTIPALQDRRNAELKMYAGLGVLKINEVRVRAGYEEVPEGEAFTSAGTGFGTETSTQPAGKSSRETFMRIMKNKLTENERMYTDEELTHFADIHGLV